MWHGDLCLLSRFLGIGGVSYIWVAIQVYVDFVIPFSIRIEIKIIRVMYEASLFFLLCSSLNVAPFVMAQTIWELLSS